MSRITITMDVDDEHTDPTSPTGLSEDGDTAISEALADFGTDVEIVAGTRR